MPELPEVETVRRGLLMDLPGDTVLRVQVLRPDSIGCPGWREFCRAMAGHTFQGIGRRGKYLLFDLDRHAGLVVHLRMSGRLLLREAPAPASHLRVRMILSSGRELHFEDMRVFGRLWYVRPGQSWEAVVPALAELGAEPLDGLSGAQLAAAFARKSQPVKSALLDQRLVAGIGNIYADECLFRAGINPLRPAGDLRPGELDRLASCIQQVLTEAIDLGGSTLRDYTDSRGVNGNYQEESWVYGRAGEPCRSCGTPVTRVKLAGRSAHFCSRCQPCKRARARISGRRA
ncbi:MAG TPA: bifunctional DNA-formamidopyrimidine glycosylase/DNA-(apurinic or apyrimidinic site) lyase [Candidatus Obscuribacterales bacterium]